MTLPIAQLNQEIRAIEAKTEALVSQLQSTYQDYLERLGETVQRQLIAACYYLCTQQFPHVFLELNYSQREKMQRSLQKVATEAKQLLTLGGLGQRILADRDEESEEESNTFEPSAFSLEDVQEPGETLEPNATLSSPESLADVVVEPSDSKDSNPNPESPDPDPSQPPSLTHPQVLLDWYSELESVMGEVLRQTSQQATKILERSGIIHNQLPEPLLEVATQSEAAENVGSGHPNILNLVVEMGKMSEEGRKSSSQRIEIVAVYLRLSDLEFTDTYLVGYRNKLRSYLQQLQSLSKAYRKRTHEYAVAQAESAWRSSWGINS